MTNLKGTINDSIVDSLIYLTNKQIGYLKECKSYVGKKVDFNELYTKLCNKWLTMCKIKLLKKPIDCN